MTDLFTHAGRQFTACCVTEPRYRVAWLTGPPLSGKTTLAQRLCERHGWHYLDYTSTPGYFDTLADTIATYRPDDLTAALQSWCAECAAPVLVVDEIDAILATWSHDQRTVWANRVSRMPYLACGIIIVTHLFPCTTLATFLPDGGQRCCLTLPCEAV
jgi:hypothetical protein